MLFYYVQYFNVKPPVEFSDHSLLSVCFSISTQRETTHMSNNDFGKFLWEEQKVDLYQDILLQNEHLDQVMNAIEKLDDENFMDIDSIVSNINSIYKNVALQTLKFKKKKKGNLTTPPTNPGRLGLRNLGCLTTV